MTTTLAFTGYDLAGNASQALTQTVVVDTVAPVFGPTTLNPGAFTATTAALLGYGTVTDGGGVAAVQLYVVRPDGSSTIVTATLSGAAWAASFVFDQVGAYQALVVATDRAGNQATQFAGTVTAVSAAATPQAPALAISRVDATTLALTWNHVTQDLAGQPITVIAYRIYRSSTPYFPPAVPWQTVSGPFGATVTVQAADLGTPGLTIYNVVAVADVGAVSVPSSASLTVAKFEFTLSPGAP